MKKAMARLSPILLVSSGNDCAQYRTTRKPTMNHRCAVKSSGSASNRRSNPANNSAVPASPAIRMPPSANPPACVPREATEGSTSTTRPTACAKMPNRGASCRRMVTSALPSHSVIDIHTLRGPTHLAHEIDCQVRERRAAQHANAQNIPGDRIRLRTVAQMARDMVEESRDFSAADSIGGRPLEDVVPLIGIERAELVAEHGLVVQDRRRSPVDVVDDVDLAAKMHVPGVALVVVGQRRGRQTEVVARQELRRRRRRSEGLLSRGRRSYQERKTRDENELEFQYYWRCTILRILGSQPKS